MPRQLPKARTLIALAICGVVITSAGYFAQPGDVRAGSETATLGKVIGEIVGPKYRVRIHASLPEALFTILSHDGVLLAEGLTRDEVALRFPTIPVLAGATGSNAGELWGEASVGDPGMDYVEGP